MILATSVVLLIIVDIHNHHTGCTEGIAEAVVDNLPLAGIAHTVAAVVDIHLVVVFDTDYIAVVRMAVDYTLLLHMDLLLLLVDRIVHIYHHYLVQSYNNLRLVEKELNY